jgi:hypothetical protein
MFVAIVAWDGAGRVSKYRDFPLEVEAAAHVAKYGGLVAAMPAAPVPDWLVADGALSVSPLFSSAEIQAAAAARDLAMTDKGLARAVEDILDALISKGALAWSDLPASVKSKIDNRKALRAKI